MQFGYLGCENGIVDLSTGELTNDDSLDLTHKPNSTYNNYNPSATHDHYEQLFGHLMEGERDRLLGLIGRALRRGPLGEIILISGERRTNKSSLAVALSNALGQYFERLFVPMRETPSLPIGWKMSAVKYPILAIDDFTLDTTKYIVQYLEALCNDETFNFTDSRGLVPNIATLMIFSDKPIEIIEAFTNSSKPICQISLEFNPEAKVLWSTTGMYRMMENSRDLSEMVLTRIVQSALGE